jgi:copper chaperone CopZ
MTKVTLHYNLLRKLNDDDCTNIAALHGVYGITRVQPTASLDRITVDYDASRLMKTDVEATLARFGVPVAA